MNAEIEPATKTRLTKILVVDDLAENLFAMRVALQGCGYEIVEALSGKEALSLLPLHDFALILLDVQMPVMDGFETARLIRREKRSAVTPIIFVTAIHQNEVHEQRGYVAGAVDYIFKPVNIEILKAKINVFAELYRKNEENLRQAELLKKAALREQELLLMKEALEARDEFLSMAAHELKTPITPLNLQIETFIKMYKEGTQDSVSNERKLRLLETSHSQLERISRLVNDLVEVARIKAGKLELVKDPVDLTHLVEVIATAFGEDLRRTECRLDFELDGPLIGNWDSFRVQQIVINLLTNAMKYGPAKPIELKVFREGQFACLSVRDHGIGIAKDDQSRIFERFERAVSSEHYGGLGLGLFIASRLVKLHEGTISVDSDTNKGATFLVKLPLMQ